MLKNFDIIKDYVLTLGDFEYTPKLELEIQMIINECLAYCYRSDVPEQMELPLADVIVSEINRRRLLVIGGEVTSYKEGDMSVSFGSSIGQAYNSKLEPFKQIIGVVQDV